MIGGIANALFTSASTRPNSASAVSGSRPASSSSVTSVTTATARRPSAVTSAATSSTRASVRAASTTSAPGPRALHRDRAAQPGPDAADHHDLVPQQHQPSILPATAAWRAAIRCAYCSGVTRACS